MFSQMALRAMGFAVDVVEGEAAIVEADLGVGCEHAGGGGADCELCALAGVENLGPISSLSFVARSVFQQLVFLGLIRDSLNLAFAG